MSEVVRFKAYLRKADDGGMWAVVSTKDQDRQGDIIEPTAFSNLQEYLNTNPVILFAHNSWEPPVGKAIDGQITQNGLELKIKFAETEFGKEIKYLYENGYMNAFSVGVIPLEYEPVEKGGNRYKKVELLEVSAVPVPANRRAVVIRSLDGKLGIDKVDEKMNDGSSAAGGDETKRPKNREVGKVAERIKRHVHIIGD